MSGRIIECACSLWGVFKSDEALHRVTVWDRVRTRTPELPGGDLPTVGLRALPYSPLSPDPTRAVHPPRGWALG